MSQTALDNLYMRLALSLAAKGRGFTSPNPMVGAVVVLHGRVVGQAYHRLAGLPHAEALALRSAGTLAQGATLYVTLEPCSHTRKRTPPCVPALVASGLRRIVVAMRDPNPSVQGRGIRQLRRAGIEITVGCRQQDAERLNEGYGHWIRTGRPFVLLKAAMTLDGKIATATGESRWITGDSSRRHVHRLRSRVDAVMVGIGTVLKDDPELTARVGLKRANESAVHQPLRVVLDSRLRIPPRARLLRRNLGAATLLATTAKAPGRRIEQLRTGGVEVLVLPAHHGRVSLQACLTQLGRRGITTVMIEGGGEVNASALREGLVNRALFYVAPRLLGGRDAKNVLGGRSPRRLTSAIPLVDMRIKRIGNDMLVEGNPKVIEYNRRPS